MYDPIYHSDPYWGYLEEPEDPRVIGLVTGLFAAGALLVVGKAPWWPLKLAAIPVAVSFGLAATACAGEVIDPSGRLADRFSAMGETLQRVLTEDRG